MSRKDTWNPLEILNNVVEGKIFDGEEEQPLKEVVNASSGTETTRAPAGDEEQTQGTKRKPSESLGESFKPVKRAVERVADTVTEPSTEDGTGPVPEESKGSAPDSKGTA